MEQGEAIWFKVCDASVVKSRNTQMEEEGGYFQANEYVSIEWVEMSRYGQVYSK